MSFICKKLVVWIQCEWISLHLLVNNHLLSEISTEFCVFFSKQKMWGRKGSKEQKNKVSLTQSHKSQVASEHTQCVNTHSCTYTLPFLEKHLGVFWLTSRGIMTHQIMLMHHPHLHLFTQQMFLSLCPHHYFFSGFFFPPHPLVLLSDSLHVTCGIIHTSV